MLRRSGVTHCWRKARSDVNQTVSLQYAAVPGQPWPALAEEWLPRLPAARCERLGRLREAADRNASLLGIALLAAALAARGLPFDAGALEFPPRGKPRLPGGPDFSIAHCAGLVAVALVDAGRVGLDVEPAGSVRAAVAARLIGPAEAALWARGAWSATDVFVMKEAAVKLTGRGIAGLREVQLLGSGCLAEGSRLGLRPVDLGRAHVAWLATEGENCTLAVSPREPGEFAPLPPAV